MKIKRILAISGIILIAVMVLLTVYFAFAGPTKMFMGMIMADIFVPLFIQFLILLDKAGSFFNKTRNNKEKDNYLKNMTKNKKNK